MLLSNEYKGDFLQICVEITMNYFLISNAKPIDAVSTNLLYLGTTLSNFDYFNLFSYINFSLPHILVFIIMLIWNQTFPMTTNVLT